MKHPPESQLVAAILTPTIRRAGAELAAVRLATGLQALGWKTDLVVARSDHEEIAGIDAGVNIVRLDARRTHRALLPLIRYLKESNPTALIAHQGRAARVACLASLFVRPAPVVIPVEHNTFSRIKSSWPIGLRALLVALTAFLYRKAAAIVHVSERSARDLEQELGLPRGAVTTIYNPIVDLSTTMQATQRLSSRGGMLRILCLGRLAAPKDVETLLEAFHFLTLHRPDVTLQIVGDGPDREALEGRAAELGLSGCVEFAGFVEDPAPIIAAADLLVLSSRSEALPTVLVEALSWGTPVVSTDCPHGPSEILDGGRFGILAPVGDPESLARAMEEGLRREWDVSELSGRAAEFSVTASARRYDELLRRIVTATK